MKMKFVNFYLLLTLIIFIGLIIQILRLNNYSNHGLYFYAIICIFSLISLKFLQEENNNKK